MLLLALLLVGAFAIFILLARMIRRRRALAERAVPVREEACVCGYLLKGLDTLRCPECGRVIGFDVTPEELGLTDQQLKQAMARRRARGMDGAA